MIMQSFQQMPDTADPAHSLLAHISTFLKQCTQQSNDSISLKRERIAFVLSKIQGVQQCSNNTVTSLIQNPLFLPQLRHYLYVRLKNILGEEELRVKYRIYACKLQDKYISSRTKHSTLVKEVLQNINSIEAEMSQLTRKFATMQNLSQAFSSDEGNTPSYKFQIKILLAIIMEAEDLDLDNPIDEMLSRLFILQESYSLILLKTKYILDQMSDRLGAQQAVSGKSQHSSNTKRSALSESLHLFLQNRVKEVEKVAAQSQKIATKNDFIRTEYLMQCRPEKKPSKAERLRCCCFGF